MNLKPHQEPKTPKVEQQVEHHEKKEFEGDQGIGAHLHTSPHKGPVAKLLTQSAYSHNKNFPKWEYKPLHIALFHNLSQVVEWDPDENVEQPTSSDTPEHPEVVGKYRGKPKQKKVKHGKIPYRMSKFKGI
jgi:hypothetical protein